MHCLCVLSQISTFGHCCRDGGVLELDKREAAGPAGEPVHQDDGVTEGAPAGEVGAQDGCEQGGTRGFSCRDR
jgi:hypothetical protein